MDHRQKQSLGYCSGASVSKAEIGIRNPWPHEPTATLDHGNQMRVHSHIRRLAAKGVSVNLSTHNPDHVFMVADRVALLHDGALAALGPPADV
ncbi:hypothetical protein [Neorhizobium galegae]|uniref:hypothetical protein n=1 Tax=Neorhizobium galegae TaxID=399 RepID=UPI00210457E5|nr:hypothetical protein [Neorhizobium galegae]MCQ1853398.1 hypothetical protein [Neorhizobium galegae]